MGQGVSGLIHTQRPSKIPPGRLWQSPGTMDKPPLGGLHRLTRDRKFLECFRSDRIACKIGRPLSANLPELRRHGTVKTAT